MPIPIQRRHGFAFFLIGFAPLTAQILLIRELLTAFYGNELSMGLILGAWMLWTGVGSLAPGRLVDRTPDKQRLLARAQVCMAFLLPLCIAYVRASKLLWGLPAGEMVDMVHMIAIAFTATAPFCILSGFMFALGCALHDDMAGGRGRSIGAIFYLEASGAAVGGLVTSLVFFRFLNHFESAFIVSLLLLLSAQALIAGGRRPPSRRLRIAVLLPILLFPLLFYHGGSLDHAARQWERRDQRLVKTVDTPYGNLTAVANGDQITVFENGLWLFSWPDPQSAEHAVHFALLQHPAPRRVLLVGGGVSGALTEVLKHPSVEQVVYVELDPGIIRLAERLLTDQAARVLKDSGVRVVHRDGRGYLGSTTAVYDVIVVNMPDPLTVQLNRFYTVEFFTEARRILTPGGVLAASLTATEHMIGPALAASLATLRQTLRQVFGDVLAYPGGTARFFATVEPGVLVNDSAELTERIHSRNLDLEYVRDYYLRFNLSPARIRFLDAMLATVETPSVNRDFSPALHHETMMLWTAQHTPRLTRFLRHAGQVDIRGFLWVGAVLMAVLALLDRAVFRSAPSNTALYNACFTAGVTGMLLSLLPIMAFQVLYGCVYYKIALLLTAFMVGLMTGGRYMTRRLDRLKNPVRRLVAVQVGLAFYGLLVWGAITAVHQTPAHARAAPLWETGFPVLLIAAGLLGGLHFPLVSDIYLKRGHGTGRSAGRMYALDLAGGALGALLSVVLLGPGLGIGRTLAALFVFNLLAAAWLAVDKNRSTTTEH